MKCCRCKIEALPGQVFARESFAIRRDLYRCPNCEQRQLRHFLTAVNLINGAIGVLGLVLLYRDRSSHGGWVFFNLAMVQVALVLSTMVHEAGHAIGGLLFGLKIKRITIGFGPILCSFNVLGIPLVMRQVPIGGLCERVLGAGEESRFRKMVFIASGAAANLFALACAYLANPAGVLNFMPDRPGLLTSIIFWVNVLFLGELLIPREGWSPDGRRPSDGLQLIRLFFPGRSKISDPSKPRFREMRLPIGRRLLAVVILLSAILWGLMAVSFGAFAASQWPSTYNYIWVLLFSLFTLIMSRLGWRASRDARVAPPKQNGREPDFNNSRAEEIFKLWPLGGRMALQGKTLEFQKTIKAADYSKAKALLEEMAARFPGHPAVWFSAIWLEEAQGRHEAAARIAEIHLAAASHAPLTLISLLYLRWQSLLYLGLHAEVRTELETHLAHDADVQRRIWILDMVACFPLIHDVSDYNEEALRWIELAIGLQPGNLTLQGTKGSLLAEAGRWEEAIKLLSHVAGESESTNDQCIVFFYLACAAKRRDEIENAHRLAKRSRDLGPPTWIQRRMAKEFPDQK